jgi:hypothetical protein
MKDCERINTIIGILIGMEKYTFADKHLIAEVVKDTVLEVDLEMDKARLEWGKP